MGQQPNIEVGASAVPRATAEPGVARRSPDGRPGEILHPDDAVAGGAFGRPGPDTGWVLKLVKSADFERSNPNLEPVVASVAAARAAILGRGPTTEDVEIALTLLGLRPAGIPEEVAAQLDAARDDSLRAAAHERVKGRAFLSRLSPDLLGADPERVRHLLNMAGLILGD